MFHSFDERLRGRGWAPDSTNTRGARDIVWPCLATIALCTIVTLHIDVPPRPLSLTKSLFRKGLWVIIGLLLPEFQCMIAVKQYLDARRLVKRCGSSDVNISMQQAFFLQSGGVGFRNLHKIDKSGLGSWSNYQDGTVWTLGNEEEDDRWVLDHSDVLFCALNTPSDEEIDDKSKADIVAKIITVGQTGWTTSDIISRIVLNYFIKRHGRYELSVLEVGTLAYIVMAAVSYYAWFHKAYDVGTMTVVDAEQAKVTSRAYVHIDRWSTRASLTSLSFKRLLSIELMYCENSEIKAVSGIFVFLGVVFAAIHCFAWGYPFATRIERILWHSSFAVIALTPAALWIIYFFCRHRRSWLFAVVGMAVLSIIYLPARFFMFAEYFLSFRHAPYGIYMQVYWTSLIGHIGV